jgi:aryl-alcohol dehydrogenase-like predicted oxidoreductase
MIRIIRRAYDEGVTFFDAAEADGPHEVEWIRNRDRNRKGTRPLRVSFEAPETRRD